MSLSSLFEEKFDERKNNYFLSSSEEEDKEEDKKEEEENTERECDEKHIFSSFYIISIHPSLFRSSSSSV